MSFKPNPCAYRAKGNEHFQAGKTRTGSLARGRFSAAIEQYALALRHARCDVDTLSANKNAGVARLHLARSLLDGGTGGMCDAATFPTSRSASDAFVHAATG
jgi:hypothetical protein